jgi:hypothetical protein
MSGADFYSNILLRNVGDVRDVVSFLNAGHHAAYVAPAPGGYALVCHEDLDTQESVAAALSGRFEGSALLVMALGGTILLYHLYLNGGQADAYVSSPHEGLELDGSTPEGNAEALCAAFGMEHRVASVERVLRRPTKPNTDYAYAINRHGELLRALKLPLFAAGASFRAIESGELPHGAGFDPATLVRTGR